MFKVSRTFSASYPLHVKLANRYCFFYVSATPCLILTSLSFKNDTRASLLARLPRISHILGSSTHHTRRLLHHTYNRPKSITISTYSFPCHFISHSLTSVTVIQLPLGFLYDHLILPRSKSSPFVQQASWFEDVVIRCVRYAFAYIPASIGRVFFSKPVSLPFLRFRMLRHGYLHSPIHWKEINRRDFSALWIVKDTTSRPDIVIYYIHGGGFSMGSSYFYLEFLLAYITLLHEAGYINPAILALEYTLVPDSSYPTQIQQALSGYRYLLTQSPSSKIVVSGDSAGGTIILSMLLHLAQASKASQTHQVPLVDTPAPQFPALAALISPWTTLIGSQDANTASDYLDSDSLHLYARQYSSPHSVFDPLISPGNCKDVSLWRKASPEKGYFVMFGREEVFASEIKKWVKLMEGDVGVEIGTREERGGIHAWPVASLFLSSSMEERQKGLKDLVEQIRARVR
jgi:acetyl esterase/lipase